MEGGRRERERGEEALSLLPLPSCTSTTSTKRTRALLIAPPPSQTPHRDSPLRASPTHPSNTHRNVKSKRGRRRRAFSLLSQTRASSSEHDLNPLPRSLSHRAPYPRARPPSARVARHRFRRHPPQKGRRRRERESKSGCVSLPIALFLFSLARVNANPTLYAHTRRTHGSPLSPLSPGRASPSIASAARRARARVREREPRLPSHKQQSRRASIAPNRPLADRHLLSPA